jgi:hypothetical protein
MSAKINIDDLFERRITYPDFAPQRLAALVGLYDQEIRLIKILAEPGHVQHRVSGTDPVEVPKAG